MATHYSKRNQEIVRLRETMTLREVAEKFGLSHQRVSEIARNAKEKRQGETLDPESQKRRVVGARRYRAAIAREESVLEAINAFWKSNYRPPTLREIMQTTGIPSISHTRYILEKLSDKGELRLLNGTRAIVPGWVIHAIHNASSKSSGKRTTT